MTEKREAVARIIDPAAFLFTPDELGVKDYHHPARIAYAKADAILALDALPPLPEDVRDILDELFLTGTMPLGLASRAAALIRSQAAEIARLQALPQAGFVMAPVEPTMEMLNSAWDSMGLGTTDSDTRAVWSAMLSARPTEEGARS